MYHMNCYSGEPIFCTYLALACVLLTAHVDVVLSVYITVTLCLGLSKLESHDIMASYPSGLPMFSTQHT